MTPIKRVADKHNDGDYSLFTIPEKAEAQMATIPSLLLVAPKGIGGDSGH